MNIFLFLVFFMLILAIFGLLNEKPEWAVFPGMAIVIGLFFHVAFLADGDITQASAGSTIVLASASTSVTSVWQALLWIPAMLAISNFLIVVYRIGTALKG